MLSVLLQSSWAFLLRGCRDVPTYSNSQFELKGERA